MYLSKYTQLLTSGSTSTSGWWFVGDFNSVVVSWSSSASLGPSRITIQTTWDDGFQSALAGPTSTTNVSLVTGINMIGNTPGQASITSDGNYRWLRATVAPANQSDASFGTVTFTGTRF